jgi:hypothetical protein
MVEQPESSLPALQCAAMASLIAEDDNPFAP